MTELDKDIRKKHDLRTRQGRADAEREQKSRNGGCGVVFITFLFTAGFLRIVVYLITVQLLGFEEFGNSDLLIFIPVVVAGYITAVSFYKDT